MEANFREKRVLNNMMHDSNIKRSLGLEKKQSAVLEVMKSQGITRDPSKLAGYQKEKFLKGIDRQIGLGYYAKKALREAYGAKKIQPTKPIGGAMDKNMEKRKRLDEIMSKQDGFSGKVERSKLEERKSNVPDFHVSNNGVRNADRLFSATSKRNGNNNFSRNSQTSEEKNGVMDALKRIQS